MQAPDPQSSVPDDTSRSEQGQVSTQYKAGTDKTLKRVALIFTVVLTVSFVIVKGLRWWDGHSLTRESRAAFVAPPPVDVTLARPTTLSEPLVLPAQTAAWFESTIYARVNGYVAHWSADIGDQVRKGQVLATIETPELDAQLKASRAQLKASEASVTAHRAETEFSRTTNERWRDSPKGVVSEQERESKKADFESAQAKLFAAEAQVALDQARVDQFAALAEFKQVVAPFDGAITERKIDVGNLVTAGSTSATTPLYRITQSDPLRVFVEVPQSAAEDLMEVGIPAQIRSAGGRVFAGKIARAAGSVSAAARTMRVEVDMPNPHHAILPGMYVNVAFELQPKGGVEVPAAALIYRSTGTQVARVDANGKVVFENVSIARDDGSVVELATGVHAGDRLILNISSQIAPGQRVAVNDTAEGTPRQAALH
jgi:RND family efflux transporter MFP subunit